jgi:hypothetical protein
LITATFTQHAQHAKDLAAVITATFTQHAQHDKDLAG